MACIFPLPPIPELGARIARVSRIGVLGTGNVGRTVASKLVEVGHEVMLGSRTAGGAAAVEWVAEAGDGASEGSLADAAAFGELVVNATPGGASLDALAAAGADHLAGKVLLDIANPIAGGSPPTLAIANDDSLGERIQRAYPDTRVVKALNTVNRTVMVNPLALGEETNLFICGDDKAAKAQVIEILETFGWLSGDIIDLGDITGARGMEMYLILWIRLRGVLDSATFNVRVVGPSE
jgi:predicted dinucleotide-binding enzyme